MQIELCARAHTCRSQLNGTYVCARVCVWKGVPLCTKGVSLFVRVRGGGEQCAEAKKKERSGETRDESLAGEYEILVAGERYALTPLRRCPYDPDGRKMRG